jgi:hypothetical protein
LGSIRRALPVFKYRDALLAALHPWRSSDETEEAGSRGGNGGGREGREGRGGDDESRLRAKALAAMSQGKEGGGDGEPSSKRGRGEEGGGEDGGEGEDGGGNGSSEDEGFGPAPAKPSTRGPSRGIDGNGIADEDEAVMGASVVEGETGSGKTTQVAQYVDESIFMDSVRYSMCVARYLVRDSHVFTLRNETFPPQR